MRLVGLSAKDRRISRRRKRPERTFNAVGIAGDDGA